MRRTFQCSSASRKFLNALVQCDAKCDGARFSALQRAENSSIAPPTIIASAQPTRFQCSSASRKFLNPLFPSLSCFCCAVSVLFSEPKIPQSKNAQVSFFDERVSVLFSEPKIPQSTYFYWVRKFPNASFSALQRAENSSIGIPCQRPTRLIHVSVLFSEPKIPQSKKRNKDQLPHSCFSALQRAENSSIEGVRASAGRS